MEVMGRHAGWIAAASGLAAEKAGDSPHIILFPEIPFEVGQFIGRVDDTIKKYGSCAIVVSEGLRTRDGKFLTTAEMSDVFGHAQLGGVAPVVSHLIKRELGHKCHWAVADYLQRAARHIASKTDVDQAYALGKSAVEFALAGKSGVMLTIERGAGLPYSWSVGEVALEKVANAERKMPLDFITEDGFHITAACREYLSPLIQGECYPPYFNGLPHYPPLKNVFLSKKLLQENA